MPPLDLYKPAEDLKAILEIMLESKKKEDSSEYAKSTPDIETISLDAALDMTEQAINLFRDLTYESISHGWTKSIDEIAEKVKAEFLYAKAETKSKSNVKFVSYEHEESLCLGCLTLIIEGEIVTFGGPYSFKPAMYPRFWISGGHPSDKVTAPWIIVQNDLPPKYQKYADEIATVFNENVEHGCCGDCAWMDRL